MSNNIKTLRLGHFAIACTLDLANKKQAFILVHMTNTPVIRTSPFQQLISALESGTRVKIGDWTISNASRFEDSTGNHFAATISNDRFQGGESFESAIALSPATKENLTGLYVDITVEIRGKMESHFAGLPFSIESPTRVPVRTGR